MSEEGKWLFVVNPKAGKKRGIDIPGLISLHFRGVDHRVLEWTHADQFSSIASQIRSGEYSFVVACGGDGTVNRVGREMLGKDAALGILPLGSGNGLARTLGLSMETATAFKQMMEKNISLIDAGQINGHPFFCTAGVGFDAHIGGLFASSETRGLRSYIQIVLRELIKYRSKKYRIEINGKSVSLSAFLVTAANAGQYGNDFYIAPLASLQDGQLQLVILKPFNILRAPGILKKILGRKAHLSASIITHSGTDIIIERENDDMIHFDGEPLMENRRLVISVKPSALKVLTGRGFAGAQGTRETVQGR
jgi:diacylglycerol kinase (ATP)